jgi:cbb3-type cytochrome oxidase subunit 3
MDIDMLREAVLLLGLCAFVGIVLWAYGPGRRSRFERAASTVFQDDAHDAFSVAQALAHARRTGEGE